MKNVVNSNFQEIFKSSRFQTCKTINIEGVFIILGQEVRRTVLCRSLNCRTYHDFRQNEIGGDGTKFSNFFMEGTDNCFQCFWCSPIVFIQLIQGKTVISTQGVIVNFILYVLQMFPLLTSIQGVYQYTQTYSTISRELISFVFLHLFPCSFVGRDRVFQLRVIVGIYFSNYFSGHFKTDELRGCRSLSLILQWLFLKFYSRLFFPGWGLCTFL